MHHFHGKKHKSQWCGHKRRLKKKRPPWEAQTPWCLVELSLRKSSKLYQTPIRCGDWTNKWICTYRYIYSTCLTWYTAMIFMYMLYIFIHYTLDLYWVLDMYMPGTCLSSLLVLQPSNKMADIHLGWSWLNHIQILGVTFFSQGFES